MAGDTECQLRPSAARAARAGMSSWPTWAPSQPVSAGKIGAVVQQEGHPTRLRHRAERVDGPPPHGIVRVLDAELDRRNIAGLQRRGQQVREPGGSKIGGVIR